MFVLDSCDARKVDGRMLWCAIHTNDEGETFIWRGGQYVRVRRVADGTRDVGRPITEWVTV